MHGRANVLRERMFRAIRVKNELGCSYEDAAVAVNFPCRLQPYIEGVHACHFSKRTPLLTTETAVRLDDGYKNYDYEGEKAKAGAAALGDV